MDNVLKNDLEMISKRPFYQVPATIYGGGPSILTRLFHCGGLHYYSAGVPILLSVPAISRRILLRWR